MNNIMENIKELRNITGAGFLDCKKALEENDNNLDKSIDFLRKKGLAKASKKSSRQANEGGIGIYINENKAVMIEINTETVFAAKNVVFLDFMDKIGNFALISDIDDPSIENFNELVLDEIKISQHFSDIISKIGENIVLNGSNSKILKGSEAVKFISNQKFT